MNLINRRTILAATALAAFVGLIGTVSAGLFSQTKTFQGKYVFGTTTLTEFDYYYNNFPHWLGNVEFDFRNDGTSELRDVDYGDTGYGTYTVFANNTRITYNHVSPYLGYCLRIEYYRVGNTNEWWGVMYDGLGRVWGHMRGQIN
jgi:hypothetical protein